MRLTLPQQDIYFEQLLFPNEPIHNIGAKIEIKGRINIDYFKKAYVILIDQHDAYRSILNKEDEEVALQIIKDHNTELGFVDFSQNTNSEEEAFVYMQNEFLKPFNIAVGGLLHIFTLVKVKEDFHYLFSVYHHIITDGWGTSLMFQRLVQNYNELLEFGIVKSEYPFTYKDFVDDDENYQNSDSFSQDKNYWVQKFKYLPENLFDKIKESIQINKSKRKELIINRKKYNQLNKLALNYKSSTFHIILGILYTYFGRKHQNNDIGIGLPVLNRSKSTYKKTVGLFMGISPLRMQLDFDNTFKDLINDIKNQLKQDYRHQRLPLGKLIQELQLFSEKERLFNITLSYEKQNYSTNFKNTQTKVIPLSHQSERVALAIYIREFDESEDVKIDFDYNLNYFDDSQISQVVSHFGNLMNAVLTDPNRGLSSFDYLSNDEKHQLLKEFNDTKTAYPYDKTVIDLFEEQVKQTPNNTAIKDDNRTYSYLELHQLSNQIAHYLFANYSQEDKSSIAVLLDRSAAMIAVLLGILKSGRSYIPLDPNFPKDRLNYIVENSQAKVIIRDQEFTLPKSETVSELKLETILKQVDNFDKNFKSQTVFNDTAYIIYTSGSTGNPKGVEIGHQSLANFLTGIQQKPRIGDTDILFSVTTYSFDISILEFFTPLISGATLYVVNQDVLSDPGLIIQKLEEIQPTIIQATPSFYQMLFHAEWKGDKKLKVLCGGDLLSESLAQKLIENTKEVWNMYGPTETTIWSSIKKIEQPKDASNIGKPINNTQFYILDPFLNPKPVGTIGAIYIAGDGLAKGYYKNEVLTKEKFIKNPFNPQSKLYETGDLGKWNENGEIEFLGRNDNQVKIRGYRIELGEIETALNQISAIKDSVVIAKKGEQQEAFLVAYVLKNTDGINVENIISDLKMTLPYYMIPNAIVELEKFPLTPNQKVDRKALLQREVYQFKEVKDFKRPNSSLEIKLLRYWNEVLSLSEPISTEANFFAIGGHSLNAVKLIGLITKHLAINISFKTIFEYPTIALLASYLQKQTALETIEIPTAEIKLLYELTPSQFNIWLASQQKNMSIAYNMFAAFSLEGNVEIAKIESAINTVIQKYEILRTNFIEINGIVYQKINDFNQKYFSVSTIKTLDSKIEKRTSQLVNFEFDLQNDLLIRVQLIQSENLSLLLFCTHHIIMDGLSLEIFIKEFINNYNIATNKNIKSELQFKDYSEWHNQILKEIGTKNELFWEKYLQDFNIKDSFEKDSKLKNKEQNSRLILFEFNKQKTLDLKKMALEHKVTLYVILITTLNVLIYKESNHTDICIGTVNSGRNRSQMNEQIGMFVKTFILRIKIKTEQPFIDLLKSVQNDLFEIEDYIDIPFDKISKSFFDVMLVYQNPEFNFESINELNNLTLVQYPLNEQYIRLPMLFNFYESDYKLKCIVNYNNNLFDKETMSDIISEFSSLLYGIIENPSRKINSIGIDESEKIIPNDFDFNF